MPSNHAGPNRPNTRHFRSAGVIPSQEIARMAADGEISAALPLVAGQIQPASLDLRLGNEAFRLRASFLPGDAPIARRLAAFEMHRFDLRPGAVLEKGCVYLVPLMERLALPAEHLGGRERQELDRAARPADAARSATAGPSSTASRARLRGAALGRDLPRSFSVLVRPGMRLNQIRCARARRGSRTTELWRAARAGAAGAGAEAAIDDGLAFSVDLAARRRPRGLARQAPCGGDRPRPGRPLRPARVLGGGAAPRTARIILDPGAFYILMSREAVTIPPDHAAEMAPYLAMVGEFRVHYAGFFDPGFGQGAAGGRARAACWRCAATRRPSRWSTGRWWGGWSTSGWPRCRTSSMGAGIASNYQGQGLKLSKHFRADA